MTLDERTQDAAEGMIGPTAGMDIASHVRDGVYMRVDGTLRDKLKRPLPLTVITSRTPWARLIDPPQLPGARVRPKDEAAIQQRRVSLLFIIQAVLHQWGTDVRLGKSTWAAPRRTRIRGVNGDVQDYYLTLLAKPPVTWDGAPGHILLWSKLDD